MKSLLLKAKNPRCFTSLHSSSGFRGFYSSYAWVLQNLLLIMTIVKQGYIKKFVPKKHFSLLLHEEHVSQNCLTYDYMLSHRQLNNQIQVLSLFLNKKSLLNRKFSTLYFRNYVGWLSLPVLVIMGPADITALPEMLWGVQVVRFTTSLFFLLLQA